MKRKQPRKAPNPRSPRPEPAAGLGERIRDARLSAGFETQRPFALRMGVSDGLVGQWEKATKKPSPGRLFQIAQVTNTSIEWLWEGKATAPQTKRLRPDEVRLLRFYERLPTHARKPAVDMFQGYVHSIIIEGRKAAARAHVSNPP